MLYATCNDALILSPVFKLSHQTLPYDDDGYVTQWLRSTMPSNSLAVVDALVRRAAERRILGADVDIEVSANDETNRRVPLKSIIARFARNRNFGFVGLVGAQSNEFPRALDIARPLRRGGINVVIGGFHVSGCLAMLPEMPADLAAAIADGITLFAGECSPMPMKRAKIGGFVPRRLRPSARSTGSVAWLGVRRYRACHASAMSMKMSLSSPDRAGDVALARQTSAQRPSPPKRRIVRSLMRSTTLAASASYAARLMMRSNILLTSRPGSVVGQFARRGMGAQGDMRGR